MTKQERRKQKLGQFRMREATRRAAKHRIRVTDAKVALFRAERLHREPLMFPIREAGWEGAQAYAKRNGIHLGTYGWWTIVEIAAGIGRPVSEALPAVRWLVKRGYLRVSPLGLVSKVPCPAFHRVRRVVD